MIKFPKGPIVRFMRRALLAGGYACLALLFILIARASFSSSLAEAAANAYYPGFCLGGWESPDSAAGAPGTSAPNGGPAAAYLAPDVFAQIFCGYFPVTPRENLPKGARAVFAFSLSGEETVADEPVLEDEPAEDTEPPSEDGEDTAKEEAPATEDEAAAEDDAPPTEDEAAVEEATNEEAPAEDDAAEGGTDAGAESSGGGESSDATSFFRWFMGVAHAAAPDEQLLLVSYSFDGVRWYAAGRVNRANAKNFSIDIPAHTWAELQNLQVMVAPLPVAGERPDIYLESITLKVEADLTLGEVAADGAAAVGGVLGAVLGLTDGISAAALNALAPAPAAPIQKPAPPAKVKKLTFEVAGSPVEPEGAGDDAPRAVVEDDGLALRVSGPCRSDYFVVLTYRSPEDFAEKPRSFVSNYAGECKGSTFTKRMEHLPIDTPPGTYYLLVAEQGAEGSWTPVSSLLPVTIGSRQVLLAEDGTRVKEAEREKEEAAAEEEAAPESVPVEEVAPEEPPAEEAPQLGPPAPETFAPEEPAAPAVPET